MNGLSAETVHPGKTLSGVDAGVKGCGRSKTFVLLMSALLVLQACTTTKTGGAGQEAEPQELRVQAGDVVFLVTDGRQRLLLAVEEVAEEGLTGTTQKSKRKGSLPAGERRFVGFEQIALVQRERASPEKTAGLVMVITAIGALVLSIATANPGPIVQMGPSS